MSFKYLNDVATPENINYFLEFIDLVAGAGLDTNNVFNIEDKLRDSSQMERCIKLIKCDPASAQMLEERYEGKSFDLEAMLNMPKDSLGWTYAKVMTAQGLDPQFYRLRPSLEQETDYVTHRIRKTHDLHHILTGFSIKGGAELGVISVIVAQTAYPGFLMIDLLSMVLSFLLDESSTLHDLRPTVADIFDIMSLGIKIGREARPLFPVRWEEGFEKPLSQWREELNIHAITEGPLSWYSDPKIMDTLV
jgi:ubiquinone biosynthesis protein COQ4